MRKLIPMILLLVFCVGCNSSEHNKTDEYAIFAFPSISEDGVYHLSTQGEQPLIYFYDAKSDQDVPLCAKVNCTHRDEQCDAYQLSVYQNSKLSIAPMYYQERLYLIYEDRLTETVTLCSSDETGSDRQEIITFPEGIILSAIMYHNNLYCSLATFEYDENGRILGLSNQYSNYVLNLNTKELTELELSEFSCLSFLGVYEDTLYVNKVIYLEDKSTTASLVSLQEKSLEFHEILEEIPENNMFLYGEEAHYYKNHNVVKFNPLTKEETILKEVKFEGFEDASATTTPDGIMRFSLTQDNTFVGYRYMDLETLSMIETKDTVVCKFQDGYIVQDQSGIYRFLEK